MMEMREYALFDTICLAKMKDNEVGSVVADWSNDDAGPDGVQISGCDASNGEQETGGPYHAVE